MAASGFTDWRNRMLDSYIQGIPCKIEVTHFICNKGSLNRYSAASDLDYYGYTEVEFEVYDRKGYKADWLANKMTDEDVERIEQEIINARD